MPFRNSIVAGTDLVREAINSPEFVTGVSGWSINRDGSAEFNDISVRGSITITGNAQSSNYILGTSGWQLRSDGTAEFNGNVDMLSAIVTGDIQSANYVANTTGWRLTDDGQAEFNGVFLSGTADGKVHTGSAVETQLMTVGLQVAVTGANTQNTPQVAGHAYQALVQVSYTGNAEGNRIRYRLWNGVVGTGIALGSLQPTVKCVQFTGAFDSVLLMFVWKASESGTIANINLGMESFSGTGNVTTRLDFSSYSFIINDIGLASRITNL